MNARQTLLSRIEAHCAAAGMSERDFGNAAVQDGRFVERLRIGKGTLRLIEKAEAFLERAQRRPEPGRRAPRQPAHAA